MIRELLLAKTDSPDELIQALRDMFSKYPQVKVLIEPLYQKRTKNQNKLYQVLVKRIAEQSGATIDATKAYIKNVACDMGYPYLRDVENELVCDSEGNPLPLPSDKANISQMKILIEACNRVALEYGYDLGDRKDL